MKKVLEIDNCTLCPHHENFSNAEYIIIRCYYPSMEAGDASAREVIKESEDALQVCKCEIPDWCPLENYHRPNGETFMDEFVQKVCEEKSTEEDIKKNLEWLRKRREEV